MYNINKTYYYISIHDVYRLFVYSPFAVLIYKNKDQERIPPGAKRACLLKIRKITPFYLYIKRKKILASNRSMNAYTRL